MMYVAAAVLAASLSGNAVTPDGQAAWEAGKDAAITVHATRKCGMAWTDDMRANITRLRDANPYRFWEGVVVVEQLLTPEAVNEKLAKYCKWVWGMYGPNGKVRPKSVKRNKR